MASLFHYKFELPQESAEGVTLYFSGLNEEESFHKSVASQEKYGVSSSFFHIDKKSQFSFLYHYQAALRRVRIQERRRVLNLGINKGDEFTVIQDMLLPEEFERVEFVGIDYCESAISHAKKVLACENVHLHTHDINTLKELGVGRFDLLISIGTLQSSNLNFNAAFMDIFQNHLEKGAAVVLGFPNCRWIDGEMIYGAKAPNYSFSEMGLVLKDIHFCKKYLQQKGYRVAVTGKECLFDIGQIQSKELDRLLYP